MPQVLQYVLQVHVHILPVVHTLGTYYYFQLLNFATETTQANKLYKSLNCGTEFK